MACSTDPLYPLSAEDKELIWNNRLYVADNIPRGLPKFIVSTPLPSRQATIEMHRMLGQWEPISPLDALEVHSLALSFTRSLFVILMCLLFLRAAVGLAIC